MGRAFWSLFAAIWLMVQATAAPTGTIRIGVYDNTLEQLSPTDLKIGLEVWIKELARNLDLDNNVTYYADPARLAEDFSKGVINMAVANPLTFIRYFDPDTMLPGIVGYRDTKRRAFTTLLLVRTAERDYPLRRFLERPVSLPRGDLESKLYIQTLADRAGLGKPLRLLRPPNAQRAIWQLFFKKSDMAVVALPDYEVACELNPQLRKSLHVYRRLRLYSGSLVFIRKGIDPTVYRRIIEGARRMPETPRGRQVMLMFRSKSIDMCYPEDLEPERKIYQEWLKHHHPAKRSF